MGFIIPSDEVARLINPIETVPRCLAGFYHVAKQQLPCYSTYKKRLPLATKIEQATRWKNRASSL